MASEFSIQQYRNWYGKLLRLYSKPHYESFGEGMEQTFNDLLRERRDSEGGLFVLALAMFAETSGQILMEKLNVMLSKNIIRVAIVTGCLLLVPLVAMQFTNEVTWTLFDFIVAGALLFGTGLTYELIARKAKNNAYRAAVGLAVGTALLLVWANLAVGIIGSEDNPANLMYIGVLAVGVVGAMIARLQPHGMARTLFATALAQIFVAAIVLVAKMPGSSVIEVVSVNAFFVALFVVSALLFQRASMRETR